ncbi:MAG TPA: 30S ribosomal protein S1 [Gemmatimonadota bacterium]|nr:30S ribosomal protein S1 [Gemmatimonadota bacterium]
MTEAKRIADDPGAQSPETVAVQTQEDDPDAGIPAPGSRAESLPFREKPTDELLDHEIERISQAVNIRPDLFDEDEYSLDEYEELLGMYEESIQDIREGQIVTGHILRVDENVVVLDVGFKSEGAVPLDEFKPSDSLEVGAEVDVFLENLEDQDGRVVLSKKKADFFKVWDKIRQAYENGTIVQGKLARKIKGGVIVDLFGVDAFLPGSQIALRRVPDIDALIGQTMEFKIIKLNKRRRNIVVSRRMILEQIREQKRGKLLEEIAVGQLRTGVVKNITDFGAFIDLGGADGLLHITDMSWGRVGHPSELVTIGDEMEIKILDLDLQNNRISLGLKQLQPYPWENVSGKYPVGSRIHGKVVSITNYGAFIELEKGVEGLVHISEMSWTRHIKHPSKVVSIGDIIEAVVLNVNEEEEKISLGMKQIEDDPWQGLAQKYPPGTVLAGKVRNLTSFGAFVEIEEGIDGLVHISDMSWTRRVHHPSEVVRKGETVKVQILNIDTENKRISLSIKDLQENPWSALGQRYSVGVETEGSVVRLLDKGVVVDLSGEVEGFVPISQLGYRNLENPADKFREGDLLILKVIESDPENRRIVLSVIDIPSHRDRDDESEPEEEGPADEFVPEEREPRRPREQPSTQMADALAEAQSEGSAEEPPGDEA